MTITPPATEPTDIPVEPQVDSGRRTVTARRTRWSFRFDYRAIVVTGILAAIGLAIFVVSLGTGDFPIPVGEVISTLFGQGTDRQELIVIEWRMPRALAALVLGAALGISGAIFQSLTRNPLGSPDIIGFNTGAYSGALIVIIIFGGGFVATAFGALAGGLATAFVVYVLAFKKGMQGFRLIIVGIAVSAMLASFNTWMILRADLEVAMSAAVWGAGSLGGITWEQTLPALVVILALAITSVLLDFSGRQLELGDDAAEALGVQAQPLRLSQTVVGVALTATATAVAGPIGFVALAAPQLARRLTGSAGAGLVPAAAMGAVLLAASDWIAQHGIPNISLPVGAVTVCLGGGYFIWLLIAEARKA